MNNLFPSIFGPPGFHPSQLANRSEEDRRREHSIWLEHFRKQARHHELTRLFSDQFVDDVAGQRVHTRFMLG